MKYYAYYGPLDLYEFTDFHYICTDDKDYTQIFSAINLANLLTLMTSNFKVMANESIQANYPLEERKLPVTAATELSKCMIAFAEGLREVDLTDAHSRHLFEERLTSNKNMFRDHSMYPEYCRTFKVECIKANLPEDLVEEAQILLAKK